MKSGADGSRQGYLSEYDEFTTSSTTRNRSPSQSGYKVEQEDGNPELNPCICISSFNPVVGQGVRDIVGTLNDANTAYISRLSREGGGEYTPASMEKNDRGGFRLVVKILCYFQWEKEN